MFPLKTQRSALKTQRQEKTLSLFDPGTTKDHVTEGPGTTEDYTTPDPGTTEDYTTPDPGTTEDYTTPDPGTTEDYTIPDLGTTEDYTTKHPDTKPEGTDSVTAVKPSGLLTPIRITFISLAAAAATVALFVGFGFLVGSEQGFCPRWAAAPVGLPQWNSSLAEYRREKLQWDLGAEHVKMQDMTPSRCASSFRVLVVSAKFEGKPLLQRYWLVNTCLAEELLHIHAFEQKTLTPEQWTRSFCFLKYLQHLRPHPRKNLKTGHKQSCFIFGLGPHPRVFKAAALNQGSFKGSAYTFLDVIFQTMPDVGQVFKDDIIKILNPKSLHQSPTSSNGPAGVLREISGESGRKEKENKESKREGRRRSGEEGEASCKGTEQGGSEKHLTTGQEAASPGEKQRHPAVQLRAAARAAPCPAVSSRRCPFCAPGYRRW
eukprot:bmy_16308T0